jgi:hypothetical protein
MGVHILRFEVLTAITMKITIFRGVTPCSLVEYTYFSETSTACIFRIEESAEQQNKQQARA